MEKTKQQRVCVVGAGISGVSAAIELQERGYDVTIYEKADRIGGKCYTQTLEAEGETRSFDMGATVVAVNFRNLLRFARSLGEDTSSANPYKRLDASGAISSMRDYYWPKGKSLRLVPQILRYALHVRRFSRKYVSPTGYKSNMPEAYRMPFAAYCRQHKMEGILPWFDLPLSAWGYGSVDETPVWYVFGEIDFIGFIGLIMSVTFGKSAFVQGLAKGYGNLVQRLVEGEGLNVQTSVEVSKIDRQEGGVVVETAQGKVAFDYLLLSAPETIRLLNRPSKAELALLDALCYSPYSTTLCTIDRKINAKLIVGSNIHKKNALRMVSAQHESSAVVVCYASIEAQTTAAEVRALVAKNLEDLGIGLQQIHEVQLWKNYFPHFSTFAGYEALLEAQGKNRTVYVGSINKFEFIEASLASSIKLIDQYFPSQTPQKKERLTGVKNLLHLLR